MTRSWRHLHSLLIVLTASTSAVEGTAVASLAQQNGGISGVVTDETNRVLVDATITATDLESGRRFVGLTDERGEYRLLNVPSGRYGLAVSCVGFETATIRSFELLVGQFERVPFTLKVGGLQDQVTVAGDQPLVNVTSSFDVSRGRSTGAQVQAVSRSGTNVPAGVAFMVTP